MRLRSGTGPDRRLRGRSSNRWQREEWPGFKVRIARLTTDRPAWSLNLDCEVASRCFERDPLANKTLFTHQVIDHISQAFLTSNTTSHSSDLLVMRVSMAMLGSIKHVTGEDQACHDNNNNNNNNNASPHALEASTRLLAWNTYSSSY